MGERDEDEVRVKSYISYWNLTNLSRTIDDFDSRLGFASYVNRGKHIFTKR